MNRSVLALAFALCASPALAAPLNVVASFSILGDLVKQIGGEHVNVTTIVGPNADTHVYEPKPSDAAILAKADVFIVNGLGFEGWMDRLVQSTGYAGRLTVASRNVTSATMDEGGVVVTDPHAWQSLMNVSLFYVPNIVGALCDADIADCDMFRANGATYSAKLNTLDAEIKERLAALPTEKRKVITTHDAFGYFGRAYGVTFLSPEGISTDAEPSAADVAKLITQIRTEGVTALFIENMSDSRLIEQIARETGATVGGELYADALSEPDGPAATYLDLFKHNADLLIPAMGGK
ncbi:MAG: metal ABC transporter substrate-binding protein [Devosia sp.]